MLCIGFHCIALAIVRAYNNFNPFSILGSVLYSAVLKLFSNQCYLSIYSTFLCQREFNQINNDNEI